MNTPWLVSLWWATHLSGLLKTKEIETELSRFLWSFPSAWLLFHSLCLPFPYLFRHSLHFHYSFSLSLCLFLSPPSLFSSLIQKKKIPSSDHDECTGQLVLSTLSEHLKLSQDREQAKRQHKGVSVRLARAIHAESSAFSSRAGLSAPSILQFVGSWKPEGRLRDSV